MPNTISDPLDVLIVGAGPVGLACGIAAKRAGLDARIVEKGCVVNSIFRFPVYMTFFTTPELLEIGDHPLITTHEKPTRKEALDYYRSVARVEALRVHAFEAVLAIRRDGDAFTVDTEGREGRRTYRARFAVIATGYYDHPNVLGIPGEDLPHVSHYYTEPHAFAGQDVTVVGGQNSACEAALDLFRHDARVTLVHRGKELGSGVKYWVRPDVMNRVAAGSIRARFETRIEEIREREVVLATGGEQRAEPCDQVFLLTGYHPDVEFLRRCGLRPDPNTLEVTRDPGTLESADVPGLYLAGSVAVGYQTNTVFIENGREDAITIVEAMCKPSRA